jgi:hypothetical protein
MGLYQYIREQEYRNDVVGDLGRWLKSHSRERPDCDSLAFKLASEEYVSCGEWTSQHAVKSLQANTEFQRIAIIEPRMTDVVSEVTRIKPRKGYNRHAEYLRFKTQISSLVGWRAENPELSDSSSYDVMIRVIDDLLPPDAADLYPDGMPDDIELDL